MEPLALDVTDEAAVQRAAGQCAGVSLVINNAAIVAWEGVMSAPTLETARTVFEINYWGYLHVARAFAPVLARNGGGAMANVLSEVARVNAPFCGSYSASKAAVWSATQCMRAELAAQGTHVLAVFPSSTDTPMLAGFGGEKQPPEAVADGICDALEARCGGRLYRRPLAVHRGADAERPQGRRARVRRHAARRRCYPRLDSASQRRQTARYSILRRKIE